MITRPKTSETPTAPRVPAWTVSVTIAPQPAKTRAKAPIASAAERRSRSGAVVHCEDLPHRVERTGHEAEVAVGAARFAIDDSGLDELLEVMADRPLREAEQRLHLADADRFPTGAQQQVDDPQPVAVGERLDHGLELGRSLV